MTDVIEAMARAAEYKYGSAGPCCEWDYEEIVRAALSAAEAAGWVLVPKEPTEEMREAGENCTRSYHDLMGEEVVFEELDAREAVADALRNLPEDDIYRAMIQSSPEVK